MLFKTFAFLFAISSVSVFGNTLNGLFKNFGNLNGFSFFRLGSDCDISKCAPTPKHYEELGCESLKKDGDCCPRRWVFATMASENRSALNVNYLNLCFLKIKASTANISRRGTRRNVTLKAKRSAAVITLTIYCWAARAKAPADAMIRSSTVRTLTAPNGSVHDPRWAAWGSTPTISAARLRLFAVISTFEIVADP